MYKRQCYLVSLFCKEILSLCAAGGMFANVFHNQQLICQQGLQHKKSSAACLNEISIRLLLVVVCRMTIGCVYGCLLHFVIHFASCDAATNNMSTTFDS